MKLLMCKPTYYGIEYEINPWMNISKAADHNRVLAQWQTLNETLTRCGADIAYVDPQPSVPDLCFTANAAMLANKKVYLAHFRYPERQAEEPIFKKWFNEHHYKTIDSQHYFEGAGDGLFLGNTLFAGYGFRSEKTFFSAFNHAVLCELIDPYFYHLDTCFAPLNDKQAIWWPGAFSKASQTAMQNAAELFAVPEEEAKQFACNAVVIGKHIVIPTGCPQTTNILETLGFTVHACDMSEFIKAGGACKCLTLELSKCM